MEMSVASWNVKLARESTEEAITRRVTLVSELINLRQPAVALFQELSERDLHVVDGYQAVRKGGLGIFVRQSTGFQIVDWGFDSLMSESRRPKHMWATVRHMDREDSDFDVWNLHLLPRGTVDAMRSVSFMDVVREIEARRRATGRLGSKAREICGGDFNEPPYSSIFCGLRTARVLGAANRRRQIEHDVVMYNPTWSILGLVHEPAGTFYKSGAEDGPWLVLDQLWISLSMAVAEPVELVSKIGTTSLLSPTTGVVDDGIGSDHLPILARFRV